MKRKITLFFILLFSLNNLFSQESTASKSVSTFSIEAPQLNCSKKIWLYLPKEYTTSKKKYPVIYMHDGQNLFDSKTSYVGEWNIDEKLDSLNAQVIVVGIEHGNEKRIDELTPYKNEKYGGGNGDNYLEFIVKTLKPKIDFTYRTKHNTVNTVIMGSSLGGLISYYALLKYPEVFGKAGVFSPAFWINPKIFELTKNTKTLDSKMYFLCGDNESTDMVPDVNKMEILVSDIRCSCRHLTRKKIVKGGQHNEKLWRDNFVTVFKWLAI
ncbi:MAG: alpha/beta hydrolase [Flavobacteriaceae bacterium]|nr:alpha/beta hydrolase [Flavobacteriaceae bacterium]